MCHPPGGAYGIGRFVLPALKEAYALAENTGGTGNEPLQTGEAQSARRGGGRIVKANILRLSLSLVSLMGLAAALGAAVKWH
jgi:hypothetical protein